MDDDTLALTMARYAQQQQEARDQWLVGRLGAERRAADRTPVSALLAQHAGEGAWGVRAAAVTAVIQG